MVGGASRMKQANRSTYWLARLFKKRINKIFELASYMFLLRTLGVLVLLVN